MLGLFMGSIDNKLSRLRRLGGSRIKISRIRGTDNVVIRGGGRPLVTMIGGNVGIKAESIVKARRRLMRRKR